MNGASITFLSLAISGLVILIVYIILECCRFRRKDYGTLKKWNEDFIMKLIKVKKRKIKQWIKIGTQFNYGYWDTKTEVRFIVELSREEFAKIIDRDNKPKKGKLEL